MTETPVPDGGIDQERSGRRRQLTCERRRGEAPSEAVIRAVSRLTATDPLELNPLYHTIDPDALDEVFERAPGVEVEVTLGFNDCRVTVTHDTVDARLDGC